VQNDRQGITVRIDNQFHPILKTLLKIMLHRVV
jgi:hypothetical protein